MTYLSDRIERMSTPEPNTGCWLWIGSLGGPGYGTIGIGTRRVSAHRASYEEHVGPIPVGAVVRHRCHTKACVNPEHLLVGTHSENISDSVREYPDKYRTFSPMDLRSRIEERSVPEPNSGCWIWTGSIISLGYGQMIVGGRKTYAHRASYTAHFGEIPKGALVLHKCDTRVCVNPQHLEIGTHQEKMRACTSQPVQSRKAEPVDLKERLDRLSVLEPTSGCLLWTGTVIKRTGYGEMKVHGSKTTAHRASWLAHRGEIPVGMVIMHACDNRLCVNPDHLSVGTRRDNSIDMARKGRGGFDRLTPEQRSERMLQANRTMGPEGRKLRAATRIANSTPDQRREAADKGWQTRRAKEITRRPSLLFNLLAPRAA